MAPAALPAPTTKVRPRGTAGKQAGMFSKGCARATAASNNWRKKAWGAWAGLANEVIGREYRMDSSSSD
jgi:hypothetical protein